MAVEGVRIKVLGRGSYGVVHLVQTTAPVHQLYAVKSADDTRSSSLRKEHQILRQFIDCSNIVRCFGAFTSVARGRKVFNLFLEYASGGSLLDLMEEYGGKIPEPVVKGHVKMILEGLVNIHRKGYIHSDLKPDNILVFPPEDGIGLNTLKIADFGLVKQYGVEDSNIWEYGFRGTAPYMSPESIVGNVSGALDIWSLGCIIVEMITGKLPWKFDNLKDLRDKLLRGETPSIPENMSSMGKNFLIKCFVRDPNHRWTARMLLNHPYLLSEHATIVPVATDFPEYNSSSSTFSSTNFQEYKQSESSNSFFSYNLFNFPTHFPEFNSSPLPSTNVQENKQSESPKSFFSYNLFNFVTDFPEFNSSPLPSTIVQENKRSESPKSFFSYNLFNFAADFPEYNSSSSFLSSTNVQENKQSESSNSFFSYNLFNFATDFPEFNSSSLPSTNVQESKQSESPKSFFRYNLSNSFASVLRT